jgi:hypothetical protein
VGNGFTAAFSLGENYIKLASPRQEAIWGTAMHYRSSIREVGVAFCAALLMSNGGAQAQDVTNYPNLKGQWGRFVVPGLPGQPTHDQTKGWGKGQQAPLTPEYQAMLEASLADQAKGGHGNAVDYARCLAGGMPSMMIAFQPLEFVVTTDTTYVIVADQDHLRRIYTDARDWPTNDQPTYAGYSIGKWVDTKGDGHYDELQVETRAFKGPRAYDASGLPLHHDNQSVINERFFLDKADPNTIYDEITVHDHALTQPWTILKKASRKAGVRPKWHTEACSADNSWVRIGNEPYYLSADGNLMPTKKNQAPPDLKYFKQTQK